MRGTKPQNSAGRDQILKSVTAAILRTVKRFSEQLLGGDVPGVTERFAAAYMFANVRRRWLSKARTAETSPAVNSYLAAQKSRLQIAMDFATLRP